MTHPYINLIIIIFIFKYIFLILNVNYFVSITVSHGNGRTEIVRKNTEKKNDRLFRFDRLFFSIKKNRKKIFKAFFTG